MHLKDLSKHYNPKPVEEKWYDFWVRGGYFHADEKSDKKSYSVVIPPPNVTDILHLGHALNNTLQDILVRWKRMQGYEVEWLPGVDHAGIATQVVLEKKLAEEGKSRQKIGREKFVQLAWEWKEKNGEAILNQLKKIGCSCDWERTRFTLDQGLSDAVLEVFIHLYKKGLIYRGERIINWCPRCQTSLSDDEAEREEKEGHLWYIKYKLKGSDDYITVATTRPETMLGDTAVAVSPKDRRFKKLVGKSAILPILDRELKIVADDFVDPEFGTGMVKVTPAHDPNDFDIGNRHKLERINILNPNGTLNENAGRFAGMDRYVAREALVAELKKKKLLEKVEPYHLALNLCYRCGSEIEPYLSEQWFVKMEPLAKPAIEAVKSGKIRFYPEHWAKVYLHWMENIRDWCISRQLWWGHRIPVWYCLDCEEIIVSKTPPTECKKCRSRNLKQDEDVLDTWFSSWLWPFSTFGWPKRTQELKRFYPTKALFTASEIIFLWVARMAMAGLEFMDEVPFFDVYIHGTVRDANGVKMSKSLGNGIDPLEIIRDYGADALRTSMILVTPEGQDPCISFNTFELGRNFANKLWNASKFVMANLKDGYLPTPGIKTDSSDLKLEDLWILSRLNRTAKDVTNFMENYKFNSAVKTLYDFVWHDFCDWYVEMIKSRFSLPEKDKGRISAQEMAHLVLNHILRLLHPFAPFVTEEIWHHLYESEISTPDHTLMHAEWPKVEKEFINDSLEATMERVQEVVYSIRNIRSEMNVPPAKKANVMVKADHKDLARVLEDNKDHIINLGRVENLKIGMRIKKPDHAASAVIRDAEIFVPLKGLIDLEQERLRLEKELSKVTTLLEKTNRKLSNEDFLKRAPGNIIEKEKAKKENYQKMVEKLNKNLEEITGW
ncbi:MAG: valine--tRNA ligase [candidate division Zixibacteria bacterium SM1_73]|nr:MAG: valine--tRNA ligase [candidate division Zixibacteria bacterium SM1_73]